MLPCMHNDKLLTILPCYAGTINFNYTNNPQQLKVFLKKSYYAECTSKKAEDIVIPVIKISLMH